MIEYEVLIVPTEQSSSDVGSLNRMKLAVITDHNLRGDPYIPRDICIDSTTGGTGLHVIARDVGPAIVGINVNGDNEPAQTAGILGTSRYGYGVRAYSGSSGALYACAGTSGQAALYLQGNTTSPIIVGTGGATSASAGLVIKASSATPSNVLEVQNSAGVALWQVEKYGGITSRVKCLGDAISISVGLAASASTIAASRDVYINIPRTSTTEWVVGAPVYIVADTGVPELADADVAASTDIVGLVRTAPGTGTTVDIALSGIVHAASWARDGETGTLTVGATYYVSTVAGDLLSSVPAAGKYRKRVGIALSTTRLLINFGAEPIVVPE